MLVPSDFQPAPYLRNPHLQTVFATSVRRPPPLKTRRERVDLPDGDFLDLEWLPDTENSSNKDSDTPIVIVLHGLTGSLESKYARGLLRRIQAMGWRGLLMLFRGASEEPNRLPRGYHSGETGDFDFVVNMLAKRFPAADLAAVGYSLGGNVLLKYLGEQGENCALGAATAVSVPFELAPCAHAINRGLSKAYQAYLLGGMRSMAEQKFSRIEPPFPLPDMALLKDFHAFDEAITAPLNGFSNVDEYYRTSSSRQYLGKIATPTLIIHAEDDPFMTPEIIPAAEELSSATRMELSAYGGHVGFVSADRFGRPEYWLEKRIPDFLRSQLSANKQTTAAAKSC